MGLKTFKPYTKSTRGTVVIDKSSLWKGTPYKPLTKGQNFTGGRNNNGRITSRHIGGGSKHKANIRHRRQISKQKPSIRLEEKHQSRTTSAVTCQGHVMLCMGLWAQGPMCPTAQYHQG